jgi:hypothetical protein
LLVAGSAAARVAGFVVSGAKPVAVVAGAVAVAAAIAVAVTVIAAVVAVSAVVVAGSRRCCCCRLSLWLALLELWLLLL